MKIAITGANGQLGRSLMKQLQKSPLLPLTRPDFDLANPKIADMIADLNPDVVIHCAAMTDVEGAAKNPQKAMRLNAFGTQNVALGCQRCGAELVYISTNEVFDGEADVPYHEFAQPWPINPYAESKLAGEKIAAHLLNRLYIVRVAWVFAPEGNNFPAKIIRAGDKYGQLKVVTDEVGTPSYAPDLAEAIAQLIQTHHYGIYHLTNSGVCSRYEFAVEILRQSGRDDIPVTAVTGEAFPRLSTPPRFTPLSNTVGAALGITLRPWQEALADYLAVEGEKL